MGFIQVFIYKKKAWFVWLWVAGIDFLKRMSNYLFEKRTLTDYAMWGHHLCEQYCRNT